MDGGHGPVARTARAPDSKSGGWGFKSLLACLPVAVSSAYNRQGDRTSVREYVAKVTTFLQEVQAETKKVTWPSRRDTLGSTLVVIVAVFVIAGFLGIIDFGLSLLIGTLIK